VWRSTQARFVDDPSRAIAHALVTYLRGFVPHPPVIPSAKSCSIHGAKR
jgi:hypothetical protein